MSKIFTFKDLDYENDNKNEKDYDNDYDNDYMLALQLQMQIELDDSEKKVDKSSTSLSPVKTKEITNKTEPCVDPQWELIDPCPDIRAMFMEFDKKYFWNSLGSCVVEWSKRMTICAGIFYLKEGGIIRLSEPLLKYRPRKDLVETLIHEMIHAYLYITRNFKDRGEHGDEFKGHMNRINKIANTNITIYHSFHDEVNHARQHVWRCNGKCKEMAPFYGYVRRSMNRAPGKNDTWWSQHQSKCIGTFEKVSEPESFKKKSEPKAIKPKSESTSSKPTTSSRILQTQQNNKLDVYFKSSDSSASSSSSSNKTKSLIHLPSSEIINNEFKKRKSADDPSFSPKKTNFKLEKNEDNDDIVEIKAINIFKKPEITIIDNENLLCLKQNYMECPICFKQFHEDLIQSHVNNHF